MIDADGECPKCGDPGPPRLVWSSDDPDEVDEVQCRVCGHHYYPGDVSRLDPACDDPDPFGRPPTLRARPTITRPAPGYL